MSAPNFQPDAGQDAASYYERIPTSGRGEFDHAQAQPADLNALSFSETSRTPYDGDASRSQGKFRTSDGTKKS